MENNVVTLDTAKKLKAAGWEQGHYRNPWSDDYAKTYNHFVWTQPGSYRKSGNLAQWAVYDRETGYSHHEGNHQWYAAPTAQEIADQLPQSKRWPSSRNNAYLSIYLDANSKWWAGYEEQIDYEGGNFHVQESGDNLAEALASLYLALHAPRQLSQGEPK